MIDLIDSFGDYERLITEFVMARKRTYFDSECYKYLKRRHDRLRDAIDMKYPSNKNNSLSSKIAFSFIRQRYLHRRAVTANAFSSDPIGSVDPIGDTSFENAANLQDLLSSNFKYTDFRTRCFDKLIDSSSRFGAHVCYTQYQPNFRKGFKTVYQPDALVQYQRVAVDNSATKTVCNFPIHILNYFQDPYEPNSEDSYYRGFIDHWRVSELVNCATVEPDNYIADNLERVISSGKKSGFSDENRYYDGKNEKTDSSHVGVDVTRMWTIMPINGNEDDDTVYYVEMVGDTIIRFQISPYDEDIVPLTTGCFRNRPDYWWGNPDSEDVMSHENFYNLMMQIVADMAMKSTDTMTFYPRGYGFDIDDLANRHETGGMIGYDMKNTPMQNMLYTWSQPVNLNGMDYVLREVKESAQNLTTTTDLTRGYNQGGLNNSTATAAAMMQQQGDILENDMLNVFGRWIALVVKKNAIMLQQFVGEQFGIRTDPKLPAKQLSKYQILGTFGYDVVSSITKNSITEFAKWQNVITTLANFAQATGIKPDYDRMFRQMLKNSDVGDVDLILPPPAPVEPAPAAPQLPPPMAAPQEQQSAPAPEQAPVDMMAAMQGAIT